MKKALVIKKKFDGKPVGSIERIGEAKEINKLSGNHYFKMVKVEVPTNFESIPVSELKGVLVPLQAEKWTKNGEADVSTNPEDETWAYVPAVPEHWEIQKADSFVSYDKKKRIKDKKATLTEEVESEAAELFQTTDKIGAVTDYLTLLSMQNAPTKWASAGIIVLRDVVGFSVGDELNTKTKVEKYAKAMLDLADDYAIFRAQKKQTFASEKTAIDNE